MLTRSLFGLRHGLLLAFVLGMIVGALVTGAVMFQSIASLH